MDFQLTSEQQRLRNKCRELAADFATRSAAHDCDASHPVENYDRLRKEGFLALTVGKEWGGLGASFLDHTIAYEVLGQGCPSTALAFNMHASVVMPLLESAEVSAETKRRIADLVVQEDAHVLLAVEDRLPRFARADWAERVRLPRPAKWRFGLLV